MNSKDHGRNRVAVELCFIDRLPRVARRRLATLGFGAESRWDSSWGMRQAILTRREILPRPN